jgi:hypothetical protein
MPVSGTAVAAGTAGIILVWSGIQNKAVLATTRSLIAGKKPVPGPASTPSPGSELMNVAPTGGTVSGSEAANQALGRLMAAPYGWSTGEQWTALNNIVMAESGWSATVVNPSSTASGIAQNINGFGPGYQSGNAVQQIAWLLAYIKNRYDTPIAAWEFHLANGYY